MTEQASHNICLALGSNLGDRLAHLRAARAALARYMTVTAVSPVYETAPAYVTSQNDFLNAALTGRTALDPMALLLTVKAIEREVGRTPTFRYGPRVIDIDILFFDSLFFNSAELSIPHPLMAERPFVLRPLADIVPEWRHSQTGMTVQAMLDVLPDDGGIRPIEESL